MEKVSFIWTIIFGLVIGVGANILTPYIRKLGGMVSTSMRDRNVAKMRMFDRSVQYLIDNPFDEVNLRVEKNGRYTLSLVAGVLSLVIGSSDHSIASDRSIVLAMVLSMFFLVMALYAFVRGRRLSRLVYAAWLHRKQGHPE